ncbi:UvrD/REP helicase family protein (macronuclear) [Tetrahymena thermophila SB210]|uniref:UvrD/REP helicase family protein n=1 Tax=Tetrahymena thermophila (strain SB210) TaxID=312017 RepID=Q23E11_TETTS|nr:UvrD/REP helicase family protein [Tetrahymena thermophila SB210]EAR94776.2 UvrD/REP helicase family protein [Tetrahymena thermophila SB210]|eukprot:XP_001015021.2 UvrD/REP helicase family protein [Tetrahymena thermophila SB210]
MQQLKSDLDRFTDDQKKFILSPKNVDIKVNACAGSGKTECILQFVKQARLSGINYKQICITTFNIQAINDIHKRAVDLFGEELADEIEIKNFDKLITKSYESIKTLQNPQQKDIFTEEVDITLVEKQFELVNMDYQNLGKDDKMQIFGAYKIIIFDEFQDINELQYSFLLLFKKYGGSNIVVVGDVFQNIYQFRGSDQKYLSNQINQDIQSINQNLKKRDQKIIDLSLSINFRCSQEITFFANEIIKCQNENTNFMKSFQELDNSKNTIKKKQIPYLEGFMSNRDQFKSIVQSINTYIEEGYSYDDIAIISPIQASLKEIEYLILQQNYKIKQNPDKNKDKKIIPYYSVIGDSSNFDYKHQFKQKNKISLSTIHRAKGLEWKIVFFIGLNDDVIPMSFLRQGDLKQKMEEMRRLFYVGCTRSAEILKMYYFCNNSRKASRLFKNISKESYSKDENVIIEEDDDKFNEEKQNKKNKYRISDFFDNLSNIQYINHLKQSQQYLKDIYVSEIEIFNKQHTLSEQQIQLIFSEQQQNLLFNYIQIILLEKSKKQVQLTKEAYYLQKIKQKIQNLQEHNYLQNMLKLFKDNNQSLERNQKELYEAIYKACIFLEVKKSNQFKYIFYQDPYKEQEKIINCLKKMLDTCFKKQDYQDLLIQDYIEKDKFYDYETFSSKDTIYEIIQSFEKQTVGKQVMLTVLGKISILKVKYQRDIKNILFYNPIQGTSVKYSLSNWNFHDQFISYMEDIIKQESDQNNLNQCSSQSFQNVSNIQKKKDEQNSSINIKLNQIQQEISSSKFKDQVQNKNNLIIDLEQSPTVLDYNQKKGKLIHAAPFQQEPGLSKRLHFEQDESFGLRN